MTGVNKCLIIGNLGRDPEMRFTANGAAVTTFSVAVNDYEDRTEWFSVVAWNKLAETCAQYLRKGRQVYIEGRMQTRSWEQEGQKKYRTELVAQTVQFLGAREGEPVSAYDPDQEDLPFDI